MAICKEKYIELKRTRFRLYESEFYFMETKTPCYAGGSKKLLAMDKKNTPVVQ